MLPLVSGSQKVPTAPPGLTCCARVPEDPEGWPAPHVGAILDARLDVDRAIARDGSQVYVQHPEMADLHDRAVSALVAAAPDAEAARRVRSLLSGPTG